MSDTKTGALGLVHEGGIEAFRVTECQYCSGDRIFYSVRRGAGILGQSYCPTCDGKKYDDVLRVASLAAMLIEYLPESRASKRLGEALDIAGILPGLRK